MNGKTGNNQLVRISEWRRHGGGQVGREIQKTERRLRVVYQYRRGLRNVIAGIKSVISNCSNGCPSDEGRYPRDEFR